MSDTDLSNLTPGQSASRDNGERWGRSAGGYVVLLRKRVSGPGFVVSTEAPARPEVPTETITTNWAAANRAFDRLMHEY
jgi:hypothetical protein